VLTFYDVLIMRKCDTTINPGEWKLIWDDLDGGRKLYASHDEQQNSIVTKQLVELREDEGYNEGDVNYGKITAIRQDFPCNFITPKNDRVRRALETLPDSSKIDMKDEEIVQLMFMSGTARDLALIGEHPKVFKSFKEAIQKELV